MNNGRDFLTHGQEKYGEPPQELGSQADAGTNGRGNAGQQYASGINPMDTEQSEGESVHG